MEKSKKKLIIFITIFIIGIISSIGVFLVYLKPNNPKEEIKEEVKNEKTPDISSNIVFNSIDDSVSLENMIPTLDKFGKEAKGFSFSIKNTTNKEINYHLKLVDDNSTINNSSIRYELTKNKEVLGVYTLDDDGLLEKGTINSNEEIFYTIKLWLDYNSDVKVGRLSKKVAVLETTDEVINKTINEPNLVDGMIPVYYNNDTNSWHKSDNKNWYNYDEQEWANAITVNKEKREYYLNSEAGTRIVPEDINAMWVWIPRFSVSIKNDDININFVSNKEKAYPAFTFDGNELEGIWIAKFESGMKENSECITSSLTKKCNNSNNQLYYVPNYPFATKMTMANMFYTIRKMELKNNIYGFKGNGNKVNNDGTIKNDNNNLDTHMIKNSEWQAVAILSISKYGKTGNNKYDSNNKSINNNNSTITGKSFYQDIEYDYNLSIKGEAASTTGNITGVYDMAGGKREYVMINNNDLNIFNKKSNSGFTTSIKDYYYDHGFTDDDKTELLQEKYSKDSLISSEPITRGGYKNIGNIFGIYKASDYIDKVSVETNSRACLVVLKEKNNEKKES